MRQNLEQAFRHAWYRPSRFVVLDLSFRPLRPTSPADAADVLLSLDDAFGVSMRVGSDEGEFGPWDDILRQTLWDPLYAEFRRRSKTMTMTRLHYGSPFDILSAIPWDVIGPGAGGSALTVLLGQIERYWHMPARIRLETAHLRADQVEEDRRY